MSVRAHQRILIAAAAGALFLLTIATAVSAASGSAAEKKPYAPAANQASAFGPFVATPIVIVATGENFPDALGAGPAGGVESAPVLLVSKNSIPDATKAELARLQPNEIHIVGGTAVISTSVEQQLGAYAAHIVRLAGANRYETAAEVSKSAFPAPYTFVIGNESEASTTFGRTCTDYDDLVVPVYAPGPGIIIVNANVNLSIGHNNGTEDIANLWIGTSPTDCTEELGFGADMLLLDIAPQLPTNQMHPWLTMRKILHVEHAGTTTFYVTGRNAGAMNTVSFWYGHMDAMYIPDPGA
jgi:hypothetical protein